MTDTTYTMRQLPAPEGHQPDPLNFAPHSVEAEEATLGAVLMNPEALHAFAAMLTPDDFFILRHGWIYKAILSLYERGAAIDIRTLADILRAEGQLELVGGEAYLNYLPTNVPTSLHAPVYAELVRRYAERRRLIGAASRIAGLAHDESKDLNQVIAEAQAAILNFRRPDQMMQVKTWRQVVDELVVKVEATRARGTDPAIPTPFSDLNRVIYGFEAGDFCVVAAPTSKGKSIFLLQCAFHAASKGHKTMFISLEMDNGQLGFRRIAQDIGISTRDSRVMSDPNFGKFMAWVADTTEACGDTLRMVGIRKIDLAGIGALVREYKRRGLCDVVFIDYLQLIDNSDLYANNRTRELEQLSQGLLNLALELEIPIVTAAQFKRIGDSRPTLDDLRWGGIEQPANKVIFIHNEYNASKVVDPAKLTARIKTELIVAKHRNGPTSPPSVLVQWNREQIRFEAYAAETGDPDWLAKLKAREREQAIQAA